MGKLDNKKQIFNMSVNNCRVKMHVDTVTDSKVISSKKGLSSVNLTWMVKKDTSKFMIVINLRF